MSKFTQNLYYKFFKGYIGFWITYLWIMNKHEDPSLCSSIGSASAWYSGGSRFESWQGRDSTQFAFKNGCVESSSNGGCIETSSSTKSMHWYMVDVSVHRAVWNHDELTWRTDIIKNFSIISSFQFSGHNVLYVRFCKGSLLVPLN